MSTTTITTLAANTPNEAVSPGRDAVGETLAARRARLSEEAAARAHAAAETLRAPRTVRDLISRAGDLAALPQVVLQVITLTGRANDVSTTEIERVIASDPALTARLLTLANSSYYGLPRRISTLREAIVFLGFKSVRNLATAITAFNLFLGKSDESSLLRRDLWKHALNAGLCGKLIASAVPNAGISGEVFTAALLHDIGKTLMQQQMPDPFRQAMQAASARGLYFHDVEAEFFGFTHAEAGALLATRWNLPPILVEAIGYHHQPGAAQSDPKTCAAVALASDFANAFGGPPASTAGSEPSEAAAVVEAPRPTLNRDALVLLDLKADALYRLSAACAAELRAGSALTALM